MTAVNRSAYRPWGFSIKSWAFAFRIWIAAVVALWLCFWLQLEAPSTAVMTVAILAEPTRGQAMEKAIYRFGATIIGALASIAITGLFSQTRDLLLFAFAVWLGLAVYVSGLLDGNRAYAGALSGYTVAVLAIAQIDSPQHVFEFSIARGSAIIVGIVSVAVINDLLWAPDRHPALITQLDELHRRVRQCIQASLRREARGTTIDARLLADIATLHPQITALAPESSNGSSRAAAAQNVAIALIAELHILRTLEAFPAAIDETTSEAILSRMQMRDDEGPYPIESEPVAFGDDDTRTAVSWLIRELYRRDRQVVQSLSALRTDKAPAWRWRAPIPRSHKTAAESGLRASLWFALPAIFYIHAGWPGASTSLSLVGVLIGLGSVSPRPVLTTTIALILTPLAGVLAAICEFVVLDGATDFPLLAIGYGPILIGSALLIASSDKVLPILGRLTLILVTAVFSPSNPQTYNPQIFIFSFQFALIAVSLLFASQLLIAPVSGSRRGRQLMAAARQSVDAAAFGDRHYHTPEEEMFRDAARFGQVFAATDGASACSISDAILTDFDHASIIRLCRDRLTQLSDVGLGGAARAALIKRDSEALRIVSHALREERSRNIAVADLGTLILIASRVLATAASRNQGSPEATA
jgi:uncharacterized membrane protein YccC